jgi:hypothetical protein
MKPPQVHVHILELRLHGFSPADRHVIADALQRELTGLFEVRGLSRSILQRAEIARLDSGEFKVAHGGMATVGRQIARAMYGGLSGD